MKPKLLLLDEPVAGMSPEETQRTVHKIKELSQSVNILMIEHDMETVFEVADRITVMTQGVVLCQGTVKEIANDPRVQEAYLGVPEDSTHA
jgi:branched-chain amino acid transport system ATP-binding protein